MKGCVDAAMTNECMLLRVCGVVRHLHIRAWPAPPLDRLNVAQVDGDTTDFFIKRLSLD